MLTRKETRKVLVEWKNFLKEASEAEPSGPIIRIFDFDGTLILYDDPQVNLIMKNPYMASFISPVMMAKLNKQYATLPKNIKDILKDTGPRTKNYIISKVSSAGFPKVKAEKLIAGLQNIEAKGDKNFEALANVVIKDVVPNWKALLSSGNTEELLKKAASVLNLEVDGMADSSHVSSVMTQEEKIDQVLSRFKIDDKFARVYTKDNIAKTEEVPMDGGGIRNAQVKGSSGKSSPVNTIAQNAFAEYPDSVITFEIYDNSTSNVAEIEGAILKASSGEQEEVEEKSEDGMLRALSNELARKENVLIKKFQAVATEGGFELRDLAGTHISKSKAQDVSTVQQSGPKLKFQKIKNKFFKLMNFLKVGGAAGRPNRVVISALETAIRQKTGDLVQELFANTVSATATTGLEDQYSSKTELDNLVEQLQEFVKGYADFKATFEKAKSGSTETPDKPIKAPKSAVSQPTQEPVSKEKEIANLRAMGDFDAADELEADDGFDAAAAADFYSDAEMYADMAAADEQDAEYKAKAARAARKAKKGLTESLNKLRLVLKNK